MAGRKHGSTRRDTRIGGRERAADGDLLAENERLRKLMLIVDEMVGEDIKAYCSEQTNREWREAISELEES
jgi:SpoVK/Ycf46/Vps4 family AAA+-type ATPase